MISRQRWCSLLTGLALLAPLPVWAGLIFNRNAKPTGPDVLIVGDVFTENALPEYKPTPDQPVYYMFMGGLERTIGSSIANEPMPDTEVIRQEVIKTLAKQNYQETKVGGPAPQLVIIFTYGSANFDGFIGDRREMSQLVGANKANRQFLSTSESEQINEAARVDRVYLMVAALDAMALAKKEKKLVWRTRISIESLRNSLPESLSLMLADAAPYFGEDTDLPVFRDDTARKASVKLGDLKFLDEPAPPAPPPAPEATK